MVGVLEYHCMGRVYPGELICQALYLVAGRLPDVSSHGVLCSGDNQSD